MRFYPRVEAGREHGPPPFLCTAYCYEMDEHGIRLSPEKAANFGLTADIAA